MKLPVLLTAGFLAATTMNSCTPREQASTSRDSVTNIHADTQETIMQKTITQVLQENTHLWMEKLGVIGTGEGQNSAGKPAIIIFSDGSRADSELESELPSEKDGYPLLVRNIGTVTPLNDIKVEVDTSMKYKK
jgi:hypothetical protein